MIWFLLDMLVAAVILVHFFRKLRQYGLFKKEFKILDKMIRQLLEKRG